MWYTKFKKKNNTMSWILNKNRFWKIITKHANKCSVIFFSIPKYSYDWNQFSAQIIWLLMLMFLTGKFRNLLNFMKRGMSWKMWHCSLFLLLAYNVLTEKKRKKIRYWAKKQNLFSCIVCSGWDLKERIEKKRKKKLFLHFFRSL